MGKGTVLCYENREILLYPIKSNDIAFFITLRPTGVRVNVKKRQESYTYLIWGYEKKTITTNYGQFTIKPYFNGRYLKPSCDIVFNGNSWAKTPIDNYEEIAALAKEQVSEFRYIRCKKGDTLYALALACLEDEVAQYAFCDYIEENLWDNLITTLREKYK